MMFRKYRLAFITFALIGIVLFIRLKRIEVNVQAFNANTYSAENEFLAPETTVIEVIEFVEVKPENRKVYSVGLDQVFTLEAFNSLDFEALTSFKGIGSVTAEAIINDRKLNGPLQNFDDLKRVKGIGEKKLSNILYELPWTYAETLI